VHNDPKNALSDGPQSVTPEEFTGIAKRIAKIRAAMDDPE
jgi:3-deoxy-7-phosphoheptulonate synthase